MKTASKSAPKMDENQFRFEFVYAFGQEPSLKVWEEENEEYASWNLVFEKQEFITC